MESVAVVVVEGPLTETYSYTGLAEAISQAARSSERVALDLKAVTRMNSLGIREFVDMIDHLATPIIYRNCPEHMVDQFNMLGEAFFPKHVEVESFYAAFVDREGERCQRILQVGSDVPLREDYDEFEFEETESCKDLELDFEPEDYFDFLVVLWHRSQSIT